MTRIHTDRPGARSASASLLCATLVLFALEAAIEPPSANTLPKDAVIADLPMLAVGGSPLVHLDLAAAGEPPLHVVLDTGFGISVAGNRAMKAFATKQSWQDEKRTLRNTLLGRPLAVLPTNTVSPQANSYPFVRVGGAFLQHFVVELDFVERRVLFLNPDKFRLPETTDTEGEIIVRLIVGNNRPHLSIQVNERPVRVALDTSAAVPAWIPTRELMKAAISPKTLPVLRPRGEHSSNLRVFETDKVQLPGVPIDAFPVLVAQDQHSDAFGANGHVMGIDWLSQYRVRLDLTRSQLWLRREQNGPVRFAGGSYTTTRKVGAFIGPFGTWFEVIGILPESPAAALGLLPGDRIDPEVVDTPTQRDLLDAIKQGVPLLVERRNQEGVFEQILVPHSAPPASE